MANDSSLVMGPQESLNVAGFPLLEPTISMCLQKNFVLIGFYHNF